MAISEFPGGLTPAFLAKNFGVVYYDRSGGTQVKSFTVPVGPNQYYLTLPLQAVAASIGNQRFTEDGLYFIEQSTDAHFEVPSDGWTGSDAVSPSFTSGGAYDVLWPISVADGYFTDGWAVYTSYNFATAASIEGNWTLGTQDTGGVINDANRGVPHSGSFVFWGNDNQNIVRISSDLVTWVSSPNPPFLDGSDRYGAQGDLNGRILFRQQNGRWASSTDLVTWQNGIAIGAQSVGGVGYSALGGWWWISSNRNLEVTTDFVTWTVEFQDEQHNIAHGQTIDSVELLHFSGGYYLSTDGSTWTRYRITYQEEQPIGASVVVGENLGGFKNIGKLPDGTYIVKDSSNTQGNLFWTTNDLTEPWSMHQMNEAASVRGGYQILEGGNIYTVYQPHIWSRAAASAIFNGDPIAANASVYQMTLEALPGTAVEGKDGTY